MSPRTLATLRAVEHSTRRLAQRHGDDGTGGRWPIDYYRPYELWQRPWFVA
jgi:hypothetical protein